MKPNNNTGWIKEIVKNERRPTRHRSLKWKILFKMLVDGKFRDVINSQPIKSIKIQSGMLIV